MSAFYRYDTWVTDALGNAIAGANVAICNQPAVTTTQPPSPLVALYSDPLGSFPIANPLISDGYGHAYAYLASGLYTVVTYALGIQTAILTDQGVATYAPPTYNNDGSTAGTITPAPNGSIVTFTLSAAPLANSLLFAVNGLSQAGFTVSGRNVTLAVAPHAGAVLNAIYQVS